MASSLEFLHCAPPGLQAEPDPAATPGQTGRFFAVDYPSGTVSNTVDFFATAPIAPRTNGKSATRLLDAYGRLDQDQDCVVRDRVLAALSKYARGMNPRLCGQGRSITQLHS
jgi:hypothetical protein